MHTASVIIAMDPMIFRPPRRYDHIFTPYRLIERASDRLNAEEKENKFNWRRVNPDEIVLFIETVYFIGNTPISLELLSSCVN